MAEALQSFLFSVQGMSCSHCLTKVKKLSVNDFGASNVSVNLDRGLVRVKAGPEFEVKKYMSSLGQLGFAATPMKEADDFKNKKEGQQFLARIGVAGACTGNIMLISFALYSGADVSQFSSLLSWLSFALFIPVLCYSAFPILKQSWLSTIKAHPSVDIPLSLALVGGTSLSVYNLVQGSDQFYFDSLSMFVFLILSSRYFIYRIQQKHLQPISTLSLFGRDSVNVVSNGFEETISILDLKPGDLISLKYDEFCPVDAELISESSISVNKAFLTGESAAETIPSTAFVPAGVQLYSHQAIVQAKTTFEDSGLSRLIAKVNSAIHHKTPISQLADKLATYFTAFILLAVVAIFAAGEIYGVENTVDRVLALLVLSCPCALAIATPLAFSLAIKRGFENGLIIKKADSFERCTQVKQIGFDKTGTLTSGKSEITGWKPSKPNQLQKNIIGSLEKQSHHPIAKAMLETIGAYQVQSVINWKETAGVGISGEIDGSLWSLEKNAGDSSEVKLTQDGRTQLVASISSQLRPEAKSLLSKVQQANYSIFILTGDVISASVKTARDLEIDEDLVLSHLSPESKSEIIQNKNTSSKVAYIGDGINDCLALANSHIAISMGGSPEATFRSSDVHLIDEDLSGVLDLMCLSKRVLRVIKTNLAVSFSYNVIFGGLAISGLMNPLIAAVLMPMSSVTVVGHTLYQLGPDKNGGQ